jgi:predicted ATP-grasp superfamily ATP-dependent carboligase
VGTDGLSTAQSGDSHLSSDAQAVSPPGAVVVGGDYQGLGIVRSLGRRGIPVCVVDDEFSIARYSKYCTHFVTVPNLRDERAIVDALLDVANRLGLSGWVLYPTREELVAAFSRNRDELGQSFRVPTPAWNSVEWAWDKRKTYQLARDLDIPTPITHYPQTIDDLAELDALSPPFVIKPAIKEHFIYATQAKAWRADSHAELRSLFLKASRLVKPGEIMVQELIPGGGTQQFGYGAFFRNGQAVGKMVVRRRRQHPLQFGKASTYVETLDVPVLEEYSERFLRAAKYYGLVELEYKLDPRDGQFKLLDVNARTWGYHSLGAAAGVDFSYMLYADQIGLSVPTCSATPGIGWVRMVTDLPAAVTAILAGDTGVGEYLRSLRKCKTEGVFNNDDLLPGLVEILLIPYLAVKRGF